ncbi:hypothetical protein BC828DRAFT_440477 [Blastocladiella britannica]|nr:hypothetical protein BC828DRAFT_440477 [Blastocladiella britannica]
MDHINITLILDRILAFAVHKEAYTLAASLPLIRVLPRINIPTTYSHVIRRLVPVHVLVRGDRLDLLRLLDNPLSNQTVVRIANIAAAAGEVPILDWLLQSVGPQLLQRHHQPGSDPLPRQEIARFAIMHARVSVLDWYIHHGGDIRSNLGKLFDIATRSHQILSLAWLKEYALESGLEYGFPVAVEAGRVSADRRVAMLAWWMADYASRSGLLFPVDEGFPAKYAWYTADDNGLLVVEWWRNYCAETGRPFEWPLLDASMFHDIVKHGSLNLCQWWWSETADTIGIDQAKLLLQGILDPMCEWGRVRFLDWYWTLSIDRAGDIEFPRAWQPRQPFYRLNVLQWWETKVNANEMDPGVFDIVPEIGTHSKLDALIQQPYHGEVEILALDWWWARRDRFGIRPRLSQGILSPMVRRRDPELLAWYLDRCTPESRLPEVSIADIGSLVSRGRVDIVEQLLQLSLTANTPLVIHAFESEIDVSRFHQRIAASAVLDYLWNLCTRIGERFKPCYNTKSALRALKGGDLVSAKWWYAMHRVHGMAFPSAEELGSVQCAPGGVMALWIASVKRQ